jgi:hypothetical protein
VARLRGGGFHAEEVGEQGPIGFSTESVIRLYASYFVVSSDFRKGEV